MNAYKEIIAWEKILKELQKQAGCDASEVKEVIDKMKRKVRRRKQNYHFSADEKIVSSLFETAIYKYPLPEYLETLEEAEEHFNEYERLYFDPSPYDCTGQHFTSWHKIFRKPDGRFWCYHSVSIDI